MRLATLLIAAPLIAACATGRGPLARVNGEEVGPDDLKREFARHHMALDRIIGDEAEVRKYLEKVIDRRLLIQEGRRMGLPDRADVRALVEAERGERARQILIAEEIDAKSVPTDDQVKAIFATFAYALEVRQFVAVTEAEAAAARAQLAAGADFEKLAREKSIAPSALQGGAGVVAWGGDPARERVVFALQVGELSAPFKTDLGWELIRVEKRMDPKEPPSYEKVSKRIRSTLERRAKGERRDALLGDLRTRYAAKALDCPIRIPELRRVLEAKDAEAKSSGARTCLTWTGGSMTFEQVARRVAIEQLEQLPAAKVDEAAGRILGDLLDERILVAEALARGLDRRPDVVAATSVKEDDAVESILLGEHVLAGVRATDEEVKRWYEAHLGDFMEPARVALAQIVVATPDQAADVQRRLAAKESFEELARSLSKDTQSAARGGFVGDFAVDALEPEFAPVAALKEGELSAPIRSARGYHLVKVLATKPARQLSLEEAKPAVQRAVVQPIVAERTKKWFGTLRANAAIEVSDKAIRRYSAEKAAAVRAEDARRGQKNEKGESRHGGAMDAASTLRDPADAPATGMPPATAPAAPPAGAR
jgi:parvulin-like peptidyl-prolyl isomerase